MTDNEDTDSAAYECVACEKEFDTPKGYGANCVWCPHCGSKVDLEEKFRSKKESKVMDIDPQFGRTGELQGRLETHYSEGWSVAESIVVEGTTKSLILEREI